MEFFNSALGINITFVRPAYFKIAGFIGIPNMNYYYIFLFFVYFISVLGNTAVMTVICLDYNLRTAKYVAVFNLAFVDLLGNTALVPKVIDTFMFNHYYISYNECLTYFFFCYMCLSMQALNLVALCYDRLVAIMFPLHYQVTVTPKIMLSMILSFWIFVIIAVLTAAGLLTRLSFCNSVVIVNSYFCDHGQIFRMACNDYSPSYFLSHLIIAMILWVPLIIVISSYICICFALFKVSTVQEGVKAFKTCTAHLSLVAIYFIPILVTFTNTSIHPNYRIINLSLTAVFPPMLNPIIYVLQTQEIKASFKKVLKIKSRSKVTGK